MYEELENTWVSETTVSEGDSFGRNAPKEEEPMVNFAKDWVDHVKLVCTDLLPGNPRSVVIRFNVSRQEMMDMVTFFESVV